MDRFEQQLHTATKEIRLSSDEKLLMREKIERYMELVPLKQTAPTTSSVFIPSFSFIKHFSVSNFSAFARARFVPAALIAGLVISTSAGVSYAAESALPGDVLYPVKVNVNEPVGGAFLFSQQERISWLAHLAERRLEEASILTAQGRLDSAKSQEVTTRFGAHTAEIKARTEELEANDPASAAEASAEVATTLEAHEAILARLAVEKDTPAPQTAALVGQVRSAAKALARISEDAEQKAFSTGSTVFTTAQDGNNATSVAATTSQKAGVSFKEEMVMRMRATARESLDQAYALLGHIENQGSESAVRTKTHIDATEASFNEGQEQLAQGEYDKAYRAFKDVTADARTVSRLLDAEALFQIEILPPTATSPTDSDNRDSTSSSKDIVTTSTGKSIRENQAINARAHAEQLIKDGQQLILSSNNQGIGVGDDRTLRATNFLKEAKAFKLRGDIALLTSDVEEASYLFRQANEAAERVFSILPVQEQEKKDTTDAAAPDNVSSDPGMPPPPMLDVVQVYHSFVGGTHTYKGIFVTPTTCFALNATAQTATTTSSSTEEITLVLTTTETNTNCPTRVLDEKPFSVKVEGSANATMTAVMLNGTTSKFVVIEGASSVLDR